MWNIKIVHLYEIQKFMSHDSIYVIYKSQNHKEKMKNAEKTH